MLAKAAALDNRNTSDPAILAWHEVIGDLDYRDAVDAVTIYRRESDAYLMPVNIRRDRRETARRSPRSGAR